MRPVGQRGPAGARSTARTASALVDTLLHEADAFINNHLLSMLGAPDFVGGLREILAQVVSDLIDDIVGPALNPVREVLADIKEVAADLVKDMIKDRFGIDIDQIQAFIDSPSSKMDLTSVNLGALGTCQLFAPDAHAKLDSYLHLAADHHDGPGGGLGDDDEFDQTQFAAYRNTVTTAKLLLLDGPSSTKRLSDLTGHTYHLYGNVGARQPHDDRAARRRQHQPRVATSSSTATTPGASDGLPGVRSRGPHPIAGNGNMPIWESCILRDAGVPRCTRTGRTERQNFPDLGDDVSQRSKRPERRRSVQPDRRALRSSCPARTRYVGGRDAADDRWRTTTSGATTEIDVDVRVRAGSATGGSIHHDGQRRRASASPVSRTDRSTSTCGAHDPAAPRRCTRSTWCWTRPRRS